MKKLSLVLIFVVTAGMASAAPASAAVSYPHFSSRTIMVEDHTSSRWPVRASVLQWDQGTDASILYGRCRTGAGCVRLYDSYQGRSGQSGQTYISWNSAQHLNPVTIRFNNSYGTSAHQARQAVQHELGHAFGLMYHSTSLGTCMYYRLSNTASSIPSAADKRLLRACSKIT